MRIAAAATILALAVMGLTGCNRSQADSVDDAALDAIDAAVADELNAAPAAIVQLVKTLDKPTPIGLDALQVSLDQKAVPVDWWLLQHGLITPILPSPGRPTFLVSPSGSQLAAQAPVWFSAAAAPATRVDCHSPNVQAAGGCEVEVSVQVQATEAGAAVMGAGAALDPIKVQAIVAQASDGWQVRELHTQGMDLNDFALTALLGKDAARAAARQQMLANLNLGLAPAAADGVPSAFSEAGVATPAPPPPADVVPVPPIVGDSPYAARRPPGSK